MDAEFDLLRQAVDQARCADVDIDGYRCIKERHHERAHNNGKGLSWTLDLDHERTLELEVERIKRLYEDA